MPVEHFDDFAGWRRELRVAHRNRRWEVAIRRKIVGVERRKEILNLMEYECIGLVVGEEEEEAGNLVDLNQGGRLQLEK